MGRHGFGLSLLIAGATLMFISCAPASVDSAALQYRIGDGTWTSFRTPAKIKIPQPGQSIWIELSGLKARDPDDTFLFVKKPKAAVQLYANGIMTKEIGLFPPVPFIPTDTNFIAGVPGGDQANATLMLRLYTDSSFLELPEIGLISETEARFYTRVVDLLNVDINAYFAFLNLFIFLFYIMQFYKRRTEITHLFFAGFNIFMALYFFGMSEVWEGLPFMPLYGIFKGCLFLALSQVLLFCLSFEKTPRRSLVFGILGIGVLLFLVNSVLGRNMDEVDRIFSLSLVPGGLILLASYLQLVRLFLAKVRGLLPLLFGALGAIICGLHDIVCVAFHIPTLVWLQGPGTFLFLLSVFVALIGRNGRMQEELEKYARGIEEEVRKRTIDLDRANAELREASAAKSEFLAHMSHEIRTPLNSIMGFSQILRQGSGENTTREYARLILEESEHLLGIINQVLDMSRIERGKLVLERRRFNLIDSLSTVIEGFTGIARQKGLQLEFYIQQTLPDHAVGDSLRFQQILINLLGNAIKFTDKGYVRLEVKFPEPPGSLGESDSSDSVIELSISDSGIGIPKDKLEHIFEQFAQVDSSITRRFGGSGLGLTIARSLVELMGGVFRITSVENEGTRIDYSVRLGKASDEEVAEDPHKRYEIRRGHFVRPVRILIVEDYEGNREVLRMLLAETGCVISEAKTGMAAIEAVSGDPSAFDLVLMDIHMPGMDGFEAARGLLLVAPNLPIVALTADAFEETAEKARSAGMKATLTKPLSYSELTETISQVASVAFESREEGPHDAQALTFLADSREAPAVDIDSLAEAFLGERDLILNLLEKFQASARNLVVEISSALEKEDLRDASLKAHALKGGALNVSAEALARLAESVESHCAGLRGKEAQNLVPALLKELARLESQVKTYSKEKTS